MTARQGIEALLARVQDANGSDQIADAMLAEIVRGPGHGDVPYYTASMDATVALIGREFPGQGFDIAPYPESTSVHGLRRRWLSGIRPTDEMLKRGLFTVHGGGCATPALALCAALLAAKLNALTEAEPK